MKKQLNDEGGTRNFSKKEKFSIVTRLFGFSCNYYHVLGSFCSLVLKKIIVVMGDFTLPCWWSNGEFDQK